MRKEKNKRTSWFKSFRWELLKIDFIQFLGRTFYIRKFLLCLIIDLIVFLTIDYNNIFNSIINVLFLIPLVIWSIIAIKDVILDRFYHLKKLAYINRVTNEPRVNFSSGGPGCGKTSSTIATAFIRAEYNWRKLKAKAFMYMGKDRSKLNPQKQKEYDEVLDAYNYYASHPKNIPCLWSNISVRDFKGRFSFKLKKKHLMQEERLPYLTVMVSDEIGLQFPAIKGNSDELKPLSEMARFIRHYLDGSWYLTEQEISKAFVDLRRVSGSNKWLNSQSWKLEPIFLKSLYNFILDLVMYDLYMARLYKTDSSQYKKHIRRSQRASKFWNKLLVFLLKYISCVGWRYYEFEELGNSENGKLNKQKKGNFVLPSCLNCQYDDRAYRNKYKVKGYKIEESKFETLTLTKEELEEIFASEKNVKNE